MPKTSTLNYTQKMQMKSMAKVIQNTSQNRTEEFDLLRFFLVPASTMAPRGFREAWSPKIINKSIKNNASVCLFASASAFVQAYVVQQVEFTTKVIAIILALTSTCRALEKSVYSHSTRRLLGRLFGGAAMTCRRRIRLLQLRTE